MADQGWSDRSRWFAPVCRPALPKDTADVIELTRTIWEGEDYVPHVWQEWLADQQGLLAVLEYGGRVLGLSKLTLVEPGAWWLEGLRVHPEHEGKGFASRLNEYLLRYWEEHGSGLIRLATASFRKPVQHLCDRSGFRKILEVTPFVAAGLEDSESDPVMKHMRPVEETEIASAAAFAKNSPSLAYSAGLIDLDWQWSTPSLLQLSKAVGRGQAWWWRGERGLLSIHDNHEDELKTSLIQLIACEREDIIELLLDYRRLATILGYERIAWLAPLHPDLTPLLMQAGFTRDWDAEIYIYGRKYPEG